MTTSSWRRRCLTGLGLFAVPAVSLLPVPARAGEEFVAGSGRARASIFEIVPRTGGLTIPVSFGRATASYQGTAAEASSTAVRVPEGSAPPAPGSPPPPSPVAECGGRSPGGGGGGGGGGGEAGGGGGAPSPTQNPLSSTIRISSEDKDSEAGRRASSLASPAGSPIHGAGSEQEVAATDDPSSHATTVEGRFGLVELIGYTQARAEAHAGVVEGRSRVAEATVTLDRLDLLDGLVVVERLRWEATQRSGDDPRAEGRFSVGRITVGGTALPAIPTGGGEPDPLAGVNTVLEPTGLALEAPRVEKDAGVVRVSPMTLRLSDSPVGRAALGPVLGAVQPLRDPLVEQLLGFSCDIGTALTVADVVASIASGSGGLSFDVGGVSATTEGTRYDNPFDGPLGDPFGAAEPELAAAEPEPLPALPNGDLLAAPLPYEAPSVLPSYGFAPPLETGAPALEPAPTTPEVAFAQPARGPSSRRLAGDRGGAALLVGALGLVAVLALAAADALHIRRAARSIP